MDVLVTVTATPHDGQPFTEDDLGDAVQAACLEVHPVTGGDPVVPVVTIVRRFSTRVGLIAAEVESRGLTTDEARLETATRLLEAIEPPPGSDDDALTRAIDLLTEFGVSMTS